MTLSRSLRRLCALAICLFASPVLASPDARIVSYSIYPDPGQPENGASYLISLELAPVASEGDHVGWQVDWICIARCSASGCAQAKWMQVLPSLDTMDGLWWVEHDNPEAPTAAEFTMPPPMAGRANSAQAGLAAMDFDIAGSVCTGDCETEALQVASILDLRLQLANEGEPELDEEEEPAETEEDEIT